MRENICVNVNKLFKSCLRFLSILLLMIGSFTNSYSSLLIMNDSCSLVLVSISPVVCFGDANGEITVEVDSGGGMYHFYLEVYNSSFPLNGGWQSVSQVPAPGQYTSVTTVPFTNLPSNTFRVILEDTSNQCFDTLGFPVLNINVSEPSEIIIIENSINATNITTIDGSASVSVSGGVSPYMCSWSGPNSFVSSAFSITNLQSGIYYYYITDDSGCLITDSIEVFALQSCSYGGYTSVPPICFGDGNGQILINSVYGTPQFTYQLEVWNAVLMNWNLVNTIVVADTFYTFTNLFDATYQYTISDNSGCVITSPQINVQDPTQIASNNTVVYATSPTNCNGEIVSTINGGVAPITHYWSGPNGYTSNSSLLTNLCIGTYCDSVVDANGCNVVLCDVVSFDSSCSPELVISNVFCNEDSSGFAVVTKTNNNYPLFTWTNILGDTISMDTFALGLPVGDYTFNAFNLGVPNACPDTSISFSILTPIVSVLSLNGDTICTGDSSSFIIETINTDSNFIYQILIGSDVFSQNDTSGFYTSGNYNYVVEVDTGSGFVSCFSQDIEIINNDFSLDSIFVVNEVCATSLGSIEVFASSNFNPLLFALDSVFQNPSLFINLTNNYYHISVSDDLGCLYVQDSIYLDLDSRIDLEVDSALETCRLEDGWISVIVQDAYGSVQYSVDSGLTFSSSIFSDTILIDSLVKGNYYLIVRDDSLCYYDYGNIYIGKTPRPKIDSLVLKNESCCGWDGEITVFSTPQNSIYQNSLDTFNSVQFSNHFDSLMRGDYLIYIKDTNECVDSIEIVLEADSTPNINFTVGKTDVVCNGDSNGTFKVYYPDFCYSYELYRYTFFLPTQIVGSGDYFNELISGFYGVIATSNSGTCIDSSSVRFIDEPSPVTFDNPIITDVRCLNNDSCTGEVLLPNFPNGGISPYYYYIKDITNNIPLGVISTSDTFTSLCNAEYEIQVVDGNACVVYDTFVIADSSLYIDSFYVENVGCFNGEDGVVEVFAHGGLGDYNYVWSNSDSINITDSLSSDKYYISITDSVGCLVYDSVFVSQSDTLQFDFIGKKSETCMGVSYDGEIYLEISGGTPPYNFIWTSFSGFSGNSGYGFGDTIFSLTYDTINVDITDANYCNAAPVWVTQSVTIVDALNAYNPLSFDTILFSTSPVCYSAHTAFISIDLNGGDGPIQYSIDSMITWSSLDSFSNLNATDYNIYVKDVYGCLDSAVVTILEYDEMVINYDSIKNISCFQGNDGAISISVDGGMKPYSYLWLPTLDTTDLIVNLFAVPHVIMVVDSVSCTQIDTIDLYEITSPIQTESSIVSKVSCFQGSNGQLTTQTFGGMPTYNYIWTDINSDTVSTSVIASDLIAGTYFLFVSDSFNCGPATDTIILTQYPEIEIDVINIVDNICFGDRLGEFTFFISGGNPNYTINISDENNNITSTLSTSIFNLLSSLYTVWVEDDNSCISDTLFGVKLAEPGRIQILNNITNLSCYQYQDGWMNIELLSGIPPYIYVINFENNVILQNQINQLSDFNVLNLDVGEYLVEVSDFNGCFVDSVFIVSQPDQIMADFTTVSDFGRESFMFEAQNISMGGDLYYWDFDNDSNKISTYLQEIKTTFLNQGEYNVMMVAHDTLLGHQCNDTVFRKIDVEGYDVFNVFTPNNDGVNDLFLFDEWMINGIYVEIYTRWGEKIFHWNDINIGWDGRGYNGRDMEEGVYFYRMEATGIDGAHFEENGSVTLLR